MQDDAYNDKSASDVAGSGHEPETPASTDGVKEDHRKNDDEAGLARSEQNRPAPREGDTELESESEYLEADLTPHARKIVRSVTYIGPLPPAVEMNAYDKETRRHILEMDRMQVEHALREREKIADAAIESDREQSKRENKLVDADIEQLHKAQNKTFVIYLSLIVALIIAILTQQQIAVGAIATLIGGVSISSMFTSHRKQPHDNATDQKDNGMAESTQDEQ